MKKFCALFLGILLAGFTSYGQLEIRTASNGNAGPDDLSGTTVTLNVTEDGTQVFSYFVINTSGNPMAIQVERYVIDQVPNWHDQFCWGSTDSSNFEGGCHPFSLMPTNPWTCNPVTIDPLPIKGSLLVDVMNTDPGCGHYRYTLLVNNLPVDSIDIIVCSTVGMEELSTESLQVYPNPTSKSIQFQTPNAVYFERYQLIDITGKMVQLGLIDATQSIDVHELVDGVYYVTLESDTGNFFTQRFSVKH